MTFRRLAVKTNEDVRLTIRDQRKKKA